MGEKMAALPFCPVFASFRALICASLERGNRM
jgi:hypothetical protein